MKDRDLDYLIYNLNNMNDTTLTEYYVKTPVHLYNEVIHYIMKSGVEILLNYEDLGEKLINHLSLYVLTTNEKIIKLKHDIPTLMIRPVRKDLKLVFDDLLQCKQMHK